MSREPTARTICIGLIVACLVLISCVTDKPIGDTDHVNLVAADCVNGGCYGR